MSVTLSALKDIPNVILQISASDLKSVISQVMGEERERIRREFEESREQPTVTRHQAARMLNITLSTLWRWAKDGYLVPVKIGSKVLYRKSDIDRMLTRAQEEASCKL